MIHRGPLRVSMIQGWSLLSADKPWSEQGYKGYSGATAKPARCTNRAFFRFGEMICQHTCDFDEPVIDFHVLISFPK